MLWVRISIRARCTTLCDKVCQWLATGRWFSPDPLVSTCNKTDRHDITESGVKHHQTNKQTNKQTFGRAFTIYLYKLNSYCVDCSLFTMLFVQGAVVVEMVWLLNLQLPMQSVPITTKIMNSNPVHGEVYSIKFVSDLRQVCGFLWVLRFPPPIKLTATI